MGLLFLLTLYSIISVPSVPVVLEGRRANGYSQRAGIRVPRIRDQPPALDATVGKPYRKFLNFRPL